MLAQDLIAPAAQRTCVDAAWEHLGVPCVYLLGRPQLLSPSHIHTCMHAYIYIGAPKPLTPHMVPGKDKLKLRRCFEDRADKLPQSRSPRLR